MEATSLGPATPMGKPKVKRKGKLSAAARKAILQVNAAKARAAKAARARQEPPRKGVRRAGRPPGLAPVDALARDLNDGITAVVRRALADNLDAIVREAITNVMPL